MWTLPHGRSQRGVFGVPGTPISKLKNFMQAWNNKVGLYTIRTYYKLKLHEHWQWRRQEPANHKSWLRQCTSGYRCRNVTVELLCIGYDLAAGNVDQGTRSATLTPRVFTRTISQAYQQCGEEHTRSQWGNGTLPPRFTFCPHGISSLCQSVCFSHRLS